MMDAALLLGLGAWPAPAPMPRWSMGKEEDFDFGFGIGSSFRDGLGIYSVATNANREMAVYMSGRDFRMLVANAHSECEVTTNGYPEIDNPNNVVISPVVRFLNRRWSGTR